ncbi:MAG: type II toxin-antitoxin system RelE/ParE family toxin [Desulfovermiculus sp.]|nr:type II toxin-antitoxin system RelE/ParE family toxin [Desulfovermiculus sp.]
MAFKLIWSPTARLDLKDITAFIAEDNVVAANQLRGNILQKVERLCDFPESGRIVPEINDFSVREIICKPCRIVYRVNHEKRIIEIVRVWHAARGVPEIQ